MNANRKRLKEQYNHFAELVALYDMIIDKEAEIAKKIPVGDQVTNNRDVCLEVSYRQAVHELKDKIEKLDDDKNKRMESSNVTF